jgi:hypothetical protein
MSTGVCRLAAAGLLGLAGFALAGCVVVSDESADAVTQQPTLGRELHDLKAARDEGAIEPGQYDEARHKLLARLDRPCK